MPSPAEHSRLSASNAHRWMECTAAPWLESSFPQRGDTFNSAEGTLAHAICELYARRKFCGLSTRKFNSEIKKLIDPVPVFKTALGEEKPLYSEQEMQACAEEYVQLILEVTQSYASPPTVLLEQRVDLTDIIPEGFGTCDCCIIGGDTLTIIDYKHGKGHVVDAMGNPQMRLYALGALKLFLPVYGDAIKHVNTIICQPRITTDYSRESLTVDELTAWGEKLKPIAYKAYHNQGTFKGGEHCLWCAAKQVCRARAEYQLSLASSEFAECVTPKQAQDKGEPVDAESREVLGLPPILTDEQVGEVLHRAETLVAWYKDVCDYALQAALTGHTIPGYKAVEGRSTRQFADAEKAIQTLLDAGVDRAKLYKPEEAKTLAQIESAIGKKAFAELLPENAIIRPKGKPTLVPDTDNRPAYSAAAADFANVI